jgi:hypothetical protein
VPFLIAFGFASAAVSLMLAEQFGGRLGRFDFYLGDGNRVRCEPGAAPAVLGCRLRDSGG